MVSKLCDNWHLEEDRYFPTLEGLQVLVVDDNDDSLELVKIILEEYGIQVVTTASASEALAALIQFKPDILISDIAMPLEDGYCLIRQIRNFSPKHGGLIPAIALTACVLEEERTRALEAGFQIHLPKPVDPDELVAVIALLAEQKIDKGLFN
jgi:CheY-like chemotaxis protein